MASFLVNDSFGQRDSRFSEIPTPPSLDGSPMPGVRHQPRPLSRGVYVPVPAFFNPINEELNLKRQEKHAVSLALAGVTGIAVHGTNGEACHLNHHERRQITRVTRAALDAAGFDQMPLIAGCGAQSAKETIELCNEASQDGADFAMVLPPSYFRAQVGIAEIKGFYNAVCNGSNLPIVIYNFPAAVGGLDLDSDLISELARNSSVVGCKFTCGNVGKINRVKDTAPRLFCFGGSADFLAGAFSAGADGVIAGFGNVAPKSLCKLWAGLEQSKGEMSPELRELQSSVAHGDWVCIKWGVPAVKTFLEDGGNCRSPLPIFGAKEKETFFQGMANMLRIEASCGLNKS